MSKTEETAELTGRALELESMVDYSDGAVVSRTLLDKKAGTLTLFSFDKGQGLSEHTAPFDATVLILDGAARITIGGEDVQAATGDCVIMPAHVPHALRADQRFKMLLIMIRS